MATETEKQLQFEHEANATTDTPQNIQPIPLSPMSSTVDKSDEDYNNDPVLQAEMAGVDPTTITNRAISRSIALPKISPNRVNPGCVHSSKLYPQHVPSTRCVYGPLPLCSRRSEQLSVVMSIRRGQSSKPMVYGLNSQNCNKHPIT